MGLQELFVCQIAADIILCIFILYMSMRLGRTVSKPAAPLFREETLTEFRKLIQESRDEAERFAQAMDDSCKTFKELANKLEEKEIRLAGLLYEAKRPAEISEKENKDPLFPAGESDSKAKYQQIINAFKAGVATKEIAQNFGLPEGEVTLIIGLEHIRREPVAEDGSLPA